MNRLKDRVAIITGGAQGIGKGTAKKFIAEGAKVAIWDIDQEKGDALTRELSPDGSICKFYQINIADYDAVEKGAAKVMEDFGKIDILLNNAGITRDATLKKITLEQWKQVIDVNLNGVFYCTKAVYPYMAEAQYGRILNASSVVGHQGNFGQTNYAAAKAGVIGMTRVWSRELGSKNITVNAVAPGFIETDLMLTIPEKVLDLFRRKTPLHRLGTVDEVANVYVFLASDESSYITGAVINVDGDIAM